jgi:cobalt-zinc-cadmium efflux system outer membrane protein
LPVNDRNQGRIWESYELWEKLEKEREALWVKLLTELNSSYATLQAVYDELSMLKHSILPAIQKASDFSYKGYLLGRFSYLELLETERSYRTSKLRYLEGLTEYHKTLAKLEGLTGSANIFVEECK